MDNRNSLASSRKIDLTEDQILILLVGGDCDNPSVVKELNLYQQYFREGLLKEKPVERYAPFFRD